MTSIADRPARGFATGPPRATNGLPQASSPSVLLYPWYEDILSEPCRSIGDFIPSTESMVVMVAFTMMALGLNIVVGYAGLLDLGGVAFYAVGAYTAGWFASQQFDQVTFSFLSSVPDDQPGVHITMWLVLLMRRLPDALRRDPDRAAHAPTARGLPRYRDARIRRDRSAGRPATATTSSAST